MKHFILLNLVLLLNMVATAQKKSDLVLANTCDCVNQTQFDSYDMNEVTQKLGVCMGSDLLKYYDELKAEFGITETDYVLSMQKIGENLGAKLVLTCPRFADISMKMMQENDDLREQVITEMSNETYTPVSFTGKVEKIKTEGFTTISVSAGDETLNFLWLEKFEGSEQFEKNPDLLKGKNVQIQYKDLNVYDGNSKTYVKKRVIKKLTVVG